MLNFVKIGETVDVMFNAETIGCITPKDGFTAMLAWALSGEELRKIAEETDKIKKCKKFPVEVVLSVIAMVKLHNHSRDSLVELLRFMTNDNFVHDHIYARALAECRPCLLVQFPQLAEIWNDPYGLPLLKQMMKQGGSDKKSALYEWIGIQRKKHGTELTVAPLSRGIHKHWVPEDEKNIGKKFDESQIIPSFENL